MEYLHVLSRPMVINHDHDITWTEAYIDSKVGPQGASRGSWVGEGWPEHLLGRHCGVTFPPGATPQWTETSAPDCPSSVVLACLPALSHSLQEERGLTSSSDTAA